MLSYVIVQSPITDGSTRKSRQRARLKMDIAKKAELNRARKIRKKEQKKREREARLANKDVSGAMENGDGMMVD